MNPKRNRHRQGMNNTTVSGKHFLLLLLTVTMLHVYIRNFTYYNGILNFHLLDDDDDDDDDDDGILDSEELRSSDNLELDQRIIKENEYDSECSYPKLPFSTMDSKPSEKRSALWEMKTHLSSTEIDDSKIIKNPLFYPGLSLRQRQEQSRLLDVLHNFLVQHSIVAIAHGGIVLGALRHHGFVPWDSDIDFHIDRSNIKRFDDAVKSDSAYLGREGIGVHKTGYMRIWTMSKLKPSNQKEIKEVVPMIELLFNGIAVKCPEPRVLRQLYTEGEVPFWTCDKEIQKWTKVTGTNICNAAWNQPNRDDRMCGKHMFQNHTTIPSKDEIRNQLKILREQTELNPEGMSRKCQPMEAYYNFVDHESNRGIDDPHMISKTNIINQLIRKRKWTCFNQNFTKLEWIPSELQFAVRNESSSVIKRNHTVISVRHSIVLEPKVCELHVTTRKTEDNTVWAKVMGLFCPIQHEWCRVDGERRHWTQLP